MTDLTQLDPRGLLTESYRIPNISAEQCRSIFLDWVLGLPEGSDSQDAVKNALDVFEPRHPEHPMTEVLREGLSDIGRPKRRGGWRSRAR